MGNRAVPAANVWAVVQAMEKAFPVLMSPAVDAVRASESGLYPTSESLALLWVQKASPAGLISVEVSQSPTCNAEHVRVGVSLLDSSKHGILVSLAVGAMSSSTGSELGPPS